MDLWTGVSDTVGVVTPNSWSLFSHAPVCSFISAGDWFILSKKKIVSSFLWASLQVCTSASSGRSGLSLRAGLQGVS